MTPSRLTAECYWASYHLTLFFMHAGFSRWLVCRCANEWLKATKWNLHPTFLPFMCLFVAFCPAESLKHIKSSFVSFNVSTFCVRPLMFLCVPQRKTKQNNGSVLDSSTQPHPLLILLTMRLHRAHYFLMADDNLTGKQSSFPSRQRSSATVFNMSR